MKEPNSPNLPPIIVRNRAVAMRDYFAEKSKQARRHRRPSVERVLSQYHNPRDGQLRLFDIKNMFEAMKDVIG